jgi:hypothetical protein
MDTCTCLSVRYAVFTPTELPIIVIIVIIIIILHGRPGVLQQIPLTQRYGR